MLRQAVRAIKGQRRGMQDSTSGRLECRQNAFEYLSTSEGGQGGVAGKKPSLTLPWILMVQDIAFCIDVVRARGRHGCISLFLSLSIYVLMSSQRTERDLQRDNERDSIERERIDRITSQYPSMIHLTLPSSLIFARRDLLFSSFPRDFSPPARNFRSPFRDV